VRYVPVDVDRDLRIHLDTNMSLAAPDSHTSIRIPEAALVTPCRLATTAISPERATSLTAQGVRVGHMGYTSDRAHRLHKFRDSRTPGLIRFGITCSRSLEMSVVCPH
jgi:hypothetical protein